jgi:hypothetical protein
MAGCEVRQAKEKGGITSTERDSDRQGGLSGKGLDGFNRVG